MKSFFVKRLPAHVFVTAAFGSGLLTVAVFLMMLYLGWPLLSSGQLFTFFLQDWQPGKEIFGIYPMIVGSFSMAFLALCFSLPISLGTACVVTSFAPISIRNSLMVMVRFMAGIPTVIYGFVAVFLLVPLMREHITRGSGLSILTASLVLAVLIAPTMIVFFVNGIRNVHPSYCLAVDALGGTPAQKLLYLQLPLAWPSIFTGILMGFGRAVGDTLISLMVAGNSIATPDSIADSGRTLTAHIALVIAADFSSMEFKTIFACGLALYGFTVIVIVLLRLVSGKMVGEDK